MGEMKILHFRLTQQYCGKKPKKIIITSVVSVGCLVKCFIHYGTGVKTNTKIKPSRHTLHS